MSELIDLQNVSIVDEDSMKNPNNRVLVFHVLRSKKQTVIQKMLKKLFISAVNFGRRCYYLVVLIDYIKRLLYVFTEDLILRVTTSGHSCDR